MTQETQDSGATPPSAALVGQLRATVTATRQLFGAAACSCALVDDIGESLRFLAADGVGAEAIVGVSIPVSRGIAGWAAMTGEPIAVADVESDARFARDIAESTAYVPRTILATPIMSARGEVSGVIEVLDPTRLVASHLGELDGTAAELAVLTLVASQLAVVVATSGDVDRLRLRDSLLGSDDGAELSAALESLSSAGPTGTRLAAQILTAVATFVRSRS